MRTLLLGCTMIWAAGAWAGDGLLGTSLPGDYVPFSPDSPFNTPIEANAESDPFSDKMIAFLAGEGPLKGDTTTWTVPLFVIDADKSPRVTVRSRDGAFHPSVDPKGLSFVRNVPIPEGVWPDPEVDGHMVLVDMVQKKAWDFSRAKFEGQGWSATRFDVWDLNDRGFRRAFRGKNWWMAGARASGMPLIAGLIRPEQIEHGVIQHALVFACPSVRQSTYANGERQLCSPPASRTDGSAMGFQYLPMGARLQLDPELNLDELGLSEGTRIIARALQTYGMYLCDGSETVKLYFQNLGQDQVWRGLGGFKDLKRIPLEKFRVLKCSMRLEMKKRPR